MDYTRLTQNGHYTGWIEVDGKRETVAPGTAGTRDRSWGVRPVGAADPQFGGGVPQFFWQWTPVNFPQGSLFFHVNNDEHGEAWNTRAASAGEGAPRAATTSRSARARARSPRGSACRRLRSTSSFATGSSWR